MADHLGETYVVSAVNGVSVPILSTGRIINVSLCAKEPMGQTRHRLTTWPWTKQEAMSSPVAQCYFGSTIETVTVWLAIGARKDEYVSSVIELENLLARLQDTIFCAYASFTAHHAFVMNRYDRSAGSAAWRPNHKWDPHKYTRTTDTNWNYYQLRDPSFKKTTSDDTVRRRLKYIPL